MQLGQFGWQVEAVDRPGFGKSPSRDVDDMNADSVWILKLLGGAHLIGYSWGGALSFAFLEPMLSADTPRDYAYNFFSMLSGDGDMRARVDTPDDQALSEFGYAILQGRMATPAEFRAAANTIKRVDIPVLVISGDWNEGVEMFAAFGCTGHERPAATYDIGCRYVPLNRGGSFRFCTRRVAGSAVLPQLLVHATDCHVWLGWLFVFARVFTNLTAEDVPRAWRSEYP